VPPPPEWPVGCHFADRCVLRIDACTTGPVPLELLPHGSSVRTARCLRAEAVLEVVR
jgi:hypothetical protein